jgi:hypothetical protein
MVLSDDGAAYAVDLNSTPWGGKARPAKDVLEYMRSGLLELLNL